MLIWLFFLFFSHDSISTIRDFSIFCYKNQSTGVEDWYSVNPWCQICEPYTSHRLILNVKSFEETALVSFYLFFLTLFHKFWLIVIWQNLVSELMASPFIRLICDWKLSQIKLMLLLGSFCSYVLVEVVLGRTSKAQQRLCSGKGYSVYWA